MSDTAVTLAPALPSTVADLMAHRKTPQSRSLNDEVDDVFLRLWENPKFRELFAAIHPSQIIEGSFASDDHVAAEMIRDYARENHFPIVSASKLAAIIFSLHVVCRRWQQSRNQRRNMVKGQQVHVTAAEAAE
jgi:hypothetical protein